MDTSNALWTGTNKKYLLALFIAVPVFCFFLFKSIDITYINDADKRHRSLKNVIESKIALNKYTQQDIESLSTYLNTFPSFYRLERTPNIRRTTDSLYTRKTYNELDRELENFRYYETTLYIDKHPYKLVLQSSLHPANNIKIVSSFILALSLLTFVGVFVKNNKATYTLIMGELDQISGNLDLFEPRSQSRPFKCTKSSIPQIHSLNGSIESLIAKSKVCYAEQRTFVSSVLHMQEQMLGRLKTLTSTVAYQHAGVGSDFEENEAAFELATRLSLFNKNLLLLTQLDECQFAISEKANISEITGKCVDLAHSSIEYNETEIETFIEKNVCKPCNPYLTEILTDNLIGHALQYNQANDHIFVILTGYELKISYHQALQLNFEKMLTDICASDIKISLDHPDLSAVYRICQYQNWKFDYDFQSGLNTFTVYF